MNDDLQSIYRESVLSHSQQPRNRRRIEAADREVVGFNRLCGDKLTVYLNVSGDQVSEAAFEGSGCAISLASASMMTEALQSASVDDARAFVAQVAALLDDGTPPASPALAPVRALEGVRNYPSRIKCASLAWSALEAALNEHSATVTTE